jgi:hypothetical protein
MILAAWLLLAAGRAEAMPALPNPGETARLVAACGFPTRDLEVRDDPLLQEDVLAVRAGAPPPSEGQLACAARASLATSVEVEFESARVRTRYVRTHSLLSRAKDLAESRAWVDQRGLLARLPAWNGKPETLAEAGAGLERLCGLEPGSLLVVRFGILTIPAERFDPAQMTSDELLCLTRAADAAAIPFGFIGNEAYRPRPTRGKTPRTRRR